MACPHCTTAATVWHHGGITPGCRSCHVRFIANSPKRVRERFYDLEGEQHGNAARILLVAEVKREFERMQGLKGRAA